METAKTILVVEDERVVARDIQRSLSDLGYSVPETAATGEQAILLASERCPDLVLMDIRIKGHRDGIETASILRARFSIPIVYMTAYADGATVARAKRTEPFGYLLKPVKTGELRSAVEIALFKHDMDRQLRDRERWLTTTMRSISDAIVSTDAAGRINYMNPVAERLTGWNAADAAGRSADEVLHLTDDRSGASIPSPLHTALREGRSLSVDGVLKRAGAGERFISDSTSPIVGDGGSLLGAVMVFRDVGDRRRLQRQLERSERLAAVGTMAAGIAHEVNNPLTYIIANLSFAIENIRKHRKLDPMLDLDDGFWMDDVESALNDAELGASRVAKLVQDVGAFIQPGQNSRERVKLDEILEWSIAVAGHELRPRGLVVRQYGATPPVDASAARLGQVFVNLLINAAHALDGARETNEIVVISRTDSDGQAVAEIRDNGCGMTAAVLERVFEPFFTTKGIGKGTGLGLSICHGILGSMGGSIVFESEPGKGTLARVTLPAATGELPDPRALEAQPAMHEHDC